ncbi:unnamed protein product [Oppiella nova]|uniref:Uncharacterized protein n=1 Tax=Oppiella nova TaxID=334625 RepID=A0A7R9LMM6_9ACAR|nr:unnamed protein product [Oppiella nova]CAG2165160.1 unnamed protein product [Oppiella nova]
MLLIPKYISYTVVTGTRPPSGHYVFCDMDPVDKYYDNVLINHEVNQRPRNIRHAREFSGQYNRTVNHQSDERMGVQDYQSLNRTGDLLKGRRQQRQAFRAHRNYMILPTGAKMTTRTRQYFDKVSDNLDAHVYPHNTRLTREFKAIEHRELVKSLDSQMRKLEHQRRARRYELLDGLLSQTIPVHRNYINPVLNPYRGDPKKIFCTQLNSI